MSLPAPGDYVSILCLPVAAPPRREIVQCSGCLQTIYATCDICGEPLDVNSLAVCEESSVPLAVLSRGRHAHQRCTGYAADWAGDRRAVA